MLTNCKYCSCSFDGFTKSAIGNHSRWCDLNPKRSENYTLVGVSAMNASRKRTGFSNQYTKAKILGLPKPQISLETRNKLSKASLGRTHSFEARQKIKEKAQKSQHRRLLRSTRNYVCKDGSVVLLDSSWEECLAKRLDFLNVLWNRPKNPIQYQTNDGVNHFYFPDFYLPEYNIFLDPKNPAAIAAQKEKLDIIINLMHNLIVLKTLKECEEYTPR